MSQPLALFFDHYLAPLMPWLSRDDVTDIYINAPGEVWTEVVTGEVERFDAPELNAVMLQRLCRQIAGYSNQGISRSSPILSATLPDGTRAQVVIPPATRGHAVLAFRRHTRVKRSLRDYDVEGAFRGAQESAPDRFASLRATLHADGAAAMLSMAVRSRCNILISGGTSTGKSTFLNALLDEVPSSERLIIIEDTPELQIRHENAVGLLASRSELSEAKASAEDLLNASLRMRPDRIILGEVRGAEAFTFLRAINTGHPGSMSTIHADTPQRALEQLALLVLQTGTQLRWDDVIAYVSSIVDISVQLERTAEGRKVSGLRIRDADVRK